MKQKLINRITNYLSVGGLFNPEYMEHDKVRDLLINCREYLMDTVKVPENDLLTKWYGVDKIKR